jgi:flap endonuclease-1
LCGCDYTDRIDGIGPVTAFDLIKKYKKIEAVLDHLKKENESGKRKKNFMIPEPFNYQDSRELFMQASVVDAEKADVEF